MAGSFVNSASGAVLLAVAILSEPAWSYLVGGVVFAIGLVMIFLRGDWKRTRGLDKLVLFGNAFYAAPLAAFGTEHFTIMKDIASMVPSFIPWHEFWAYFVGACFIAAALSMVMRIQAQLAASLVALTFFLFVALMDVPGWVQEPGNRFAATLALRELCFSCGALALAAGLAAESDQQGARILGMIRATTAATIARYVIAVAILFYSFEQFMHGDYVPAIPLDRLTPAYVPGHAIWTYLTAAAYVVPGILLLVGKTTRAAASWIGATVLFIDLIVYLPIAYADRATLVGINYVGDTLMFCGAILLLAGAMPRES